MPLNDCGNDKWCKPCDLPLATNSVARISLSLREYLTAITCIPWYHGHENKPKEDGQYGVVEFIASDKTGSPNRKLIKSGEIEHCETVTNSRSYTMRLSVKGVKQFANDGEIFTYYPMDVLADIEDKHFSFIELKKALSDKGIVVIRFNGVTALVKTDDGCCSDNQAQMNIEICVDRKVSMSRKIIQAMCLKLCSGEVICPQDQQDCPDDNNL